MSDARPPVLIDPADDGSMIYVCLYCGGTGPWNESGAHVCQAVPKVSIEALMKARFSIWRKP